MIDSQKHVLEQVLNLVQEEVVSCLLLCGDIFDKQVPTLGALELFDEFLNKLSDLNKKVFIIYGNHDNADRMTYLSTFLRKSNIFISQNFNGELQYFDIENDIRIYLMPYLYPAIIKKFFPCEEISNYNQAFEVLFKNTEVDKNKINILLAHQFVIGAKEPIVCQSEEKSVGGVDSINYQIFNDFDYVALGHLHCPQSVGRKEIRYSGSILKYSFSEVNHTKSFCIVDVKGKNELKIDFKEIEFLLDLKEYKGYFEEFVDEKFYSKINKDDYIHFILQDEILLDAKKKLSMIYPNIMLLEFDNNFTKNLNSDFSCNTQDKTIYEHFCDFYLKQMGQNLDKEKEKILLEILNKEGE